MATYVDYVDGCMGGATNKTMAARTSHFDGSGN